MLLAGLVVVLALALALLPLRLALGLALGGVALAALVEPVLGLYAVVLSVPLQEALLLPGGATFTQALMVLALGAWLLRVLAHPEKRLRWSGLLAPWALLLWVLVLATAFSPYGLGNGLRESSRWAVACAAFVLTINLADDRRRALLLVGCVLAAPALAALPGLLQFVRADGPPSYEILDGRFVRAYGTFGTPNTFAGYMNMGWPLAAALGVWLLQRQLRPIGLPASSSSGLLAWLGRWWVLGLVGLAGALAGAGLLASFSRGAWLGAVAAALALTALAGRRFALGVGTALLVGGLVVGAGEVDLLPDALRARVGSIAANLRVFDASNVAVTPENFAIVERMAHWQAGARMALDRPLLGVGPGSFNDAYPAYFVGHWSGSRGHAHNYYIHIAAEAGLLGLIAYLLLLAGLAVLAARALRTTPAGMWRGVVFGVCGMMVAVAVHNVFENLHVLNMGIQQAVCWGLLARAPSLARGQRRDEAE